MILSKYNPQKNTTVQCAVYNLCAPLSASCKFIGRFNSCMAVQISPHATRAWDWIWAEAKAERGRERDKERERAQAWAAYVFGFIYMLPFLFLVD